MLYTTPNKNISSVLGTTPEDVDTGSYRSDRVLLMAVIILMIFGVLAVYSAIAFFAESKHTSAGSLVIEHAIKLGIAFLGMLIFSKIDYHVLEKFSKYVLMLSWGLLVAVLYIGSEQFGAKRSLNIIGFTFQPAALASLALIIHVAVLTAKKQDYIKSLSRSFIPIIIYEFITCGLIGIEDFSTSAILMGICLLIMFVGRANMLHISSLILFAGFGAALLIWSSPERKHRLEQYADQVVNINSEHFNTGQGYQAQQADIAIARGEIFGVGMGKSTQRDFLPAPYNDFIFAIIAEEYGLIGSIFLLLIFTVILFRGIGKIAKSAPDSLGKLLSVGCTLAITLYGFVNAGVASGLLPVTGLPMPFVSYGGTSTLIAGVMVGILMNISKHSNTQNAFFYA